MGLKPLPGERGLYEQATGSYSAIVYKDGELTVAEDSQGSLITEGIDATTVIQNAIDYLLDAIGGGVIYLTAGKYRIRSGDWFIKDKIELVGAGKDKTILEIYYDDITTSAGLNCLLRNYDTTNGNLWFAVRNMTIRVDNESFENADQSARAIIFANCKNVEIGNVKHRLMLRPLAGANESGELFFFGTGDIGSTSNITVKDCEFYNGVTLEGDNIDTMFKVTRAKNVTIENCYSDGEGADGKSLSYGFNYNIAACVDLTISKCYGRKAETGTWIEPSGSYTLNKVKVLDSVFEDQRGRGVGVSSNISDDSEVKIQCTARNVGTNGIGDEKYIARVVGCEVYEHAQNADSVTHGITGNEVIGCKLKSVSNKYQAGIIAYEKMVGCRVKTYGWGSDPGFVDDVLVTNCRFIRATDNVWFSGFVNLRYCNYWKIADCYFDNSSIRILYNGTDGKGHSTKDNTFDCPDISPSIRWGNTVPVDLVVEDNDFRRASSPVVNSDITDEATNKVKKNKGYVTENWDTSTFSGDGATTVFNVSSHGLVENPSDRTRIKAYATTQSADADDVAPVSAYPVDLDGDGNYEGLKIVFASAPASGTDNVKVKWYAGLD